MRTKGAGQIENHASSAPENVSGLIPVTLEQKPGGVTTDKVVRSAARRGSIARASATRIPRVRHSRIGIPLTAALLCKLPFALARRIFLRSQNSFSLHM